MTPAGPGARAANSAHRSVSCNILIRVRLRFREITGARGGLEIWRLEMCSVAQVEPHLRSIAGDVEEGCTLPRVGEHPAWGLPVLLRDGIFHPDGRVLARPGDLLRIRLTVGLQSAMAAQFVAENSPNGRPEPDSIRTKCAEFDSGSRCRDLDQRVGVDLSGGKRR